MYNVYLISSTIEGDTCYKIGYTKRNPLQRIKEMKTGNASELELIDQYKSKWGTQIESKLNCSCIFAIAKSTSNKSTFSLYFLIYFIVVYIIWKVHF